MKDKVELKRKLIVMLKNYERIIEECDPMYRDYMRMECSGSINSLKAIIDSL